MKTVRRQYLVWMFGPTHHSGHPVGSTASEAASGAADFLGFVTGEKHLGVYSEDPGMCLIWADSSV